MVLAGMLMQAAFGLPPAIRMAAFDAPICGVPHAPGETDRPAPATHDHAHCVLCQAGAGPPLAEAATGVPLPPALHATAPEPAVMPLALRPPVTGYASRAPPALA